ncbi:MAG: type II toxin-antitoxin system RelE/ParE family toxin [Bacteroidia bacterium]|nr:type II toxin-antitoxin system RelE/ParE family toxin [Bacteroidia bacterium]
MIRNVIWTPEATETFNNNLDYLEKEWDLKVSDQFTERAHSVILKISQNPKLYACVDRKTNLFRSVSFWNNYQDPEKMPV